MYQEFWRRYLFRILVLLPFVAIIGFIPPYPLEAKLFGLLAVLVLMLIAQLVEVLVYLRSTRQLHQMDIDESEHRQDSWSADSRKARRRRARLENPNDHG